MGGSHGGGGLHPEPPPEAVREALGLEQGLVSSRDNVTAEVSRRRTAALTLISEEEGTHCFPLDSVH